jgi:hypothetical protein
MQSHQTRHDFGKVFEHIDQWYLLDLTEIQGGGIIQDGGKSIFTANDDIRKPPFVKLKFILWLNFWQKTSKNITKWRRYRRLFFSNFFFYISGCSEPISMNPHFGKRKQYVIGSHLSELGIF